MTYLNNAKVNIKYLFVKAFMLSLLINNDYFYNVFLENYSIIYLNSSVLM